MRLKSSLLTYARLAAFYSLLSAGPSNAQTQAAAAQTPKAQQTQPETRYGNGWLLAGYGQGKMNNGLGKDLFGRDLTARLGTKEASIHGIFTSDRVYVNARAGLVSAGGPVTSNEGGAGKEDLISKAVEILAQYGFKIGENGIYAGASGELDVDKSTQEGYLVNPRRPPDASQRSSLDGDSTVRSALGGWSIGYANDGNRVSISGLYGNSNLKGKLLSGRVDAVANGNAGTVFASADFTKYDGRAGFPRGTESDIDFLYVLPMGIAGVRPALELRLKQMGNNSYRAVAVQFSKEIRK